MTQSRFDTGMQVRREVLGDAHVDRAMANATPLDADFQRWITEITEMLFHVAVYAGVPAANHAFAVAKTNLES
jgi:alkylhydroperoxidase/carboxymuconolactone decarboxylase family protein YurZ